MVKYYVEKILDGLEASQIQRETVEADNFVITAVGSLIFFNKEDSYVSGINPLNNNVASYNAFAWRSVSQEE